MATNNTTTEISSDENRTRKARDEDMHAVVAEPVDGGDDDVARINIANKSSGTIYTVTVDESGTVERCTCPDWRHNLSDGSLCKHSRFVAAHDPILIAATGDMSVGTDCECSERTDFPCWSCYVSGRKDLPSE